MKVAITGGTGFLAAHIIQQILTSHPDISIIATVRDLQRAAFLTALPGKQDETRLKLVVADLSKPETFEGVFQGCDAVLHVASPYILSGVKDPMKELVEPAVNGTKAILQEAQRAKTVKRVVITSSTVAITGEARPGHTFTESDWNTAATLTYQSYGYSKVQAEKAAWSFMENTPSSEINFDLIVLNPSGIFGPSLSKNINETNGIFISFAKREIPALMHNNIPLVDVRDCAQAHILALTPSIPSGRYIISSYTKSMPDLAALVAKAYPAIAKSLPSVTLPDWLAKGMAYMLGQQGHGLRAGIGKGGNVLDNGKGRKALGWKSRDLEESLRDTFEDLVRWGHIVV
ncbi:hypothetical protein HK097_005136 [Rhizophlyctis rosea]|uniref:Thioester reductase (TE) domain-containing protein n=1 Tax=Rhizophlyctis rosea TaxID=64517 RepID=A0AAD5SDN5_9FUNG|nr:hypothetical protein HK097_005136 [Rhizophlyctis rosea]